MKITAIVQARMGSSRLPGKVLMDLEGEPVLARVIDRSRRSSRLDEVVVATTTGSSDDALVAFCKARGYGVFRGSEDDVLDRYYQVAKELRPDAIVRITSDCPLIEPEINDRVIGQFLSATAPIDYACTFLPQHTFPRGLDVEIITYEALERAWHQDTNPDWREHVTEYVLHHPELFPWQGVVNDVDYSEHRWTVDTPEDLELVRKIYAAFGHDQFSWREVLDLVARNPEWIEINRHVEQKVVE